MFLIILGLILFVLLVVVHEWGHFIAARKNGVEVEEFGIGFPPRAKVLTKRKGTMYTLNWLPLGGFVSLKGEHSSAKGKGTFGEASFAKKTLIIFAGVLMNWLAAAFIFTIVALVGMPHLIENQFKVSSDAKESYQIVVSSVQEGSPAEGVGVSDTAVLKAVDGQELSSTDEFIEYVDAKRGEQVSLTYAQNGSEQTKEITLRENENEGPTGLQVVQVTSVRSTWSAPVVGVATTAQLTAETYKGLFNAVKNLVIGERGEASKSVTGPVGIFGLLKALSNQGFPFVLFLIGVLSLSLAVFNSLPIPALDGGRWFVMAAYKVFKKPLTKETEERIHGTGMAVLLLLIVAVTILDIQRL